MTIKSVDELNGKIEIDLTGPDGNAFALMARAEELAKMVNRRRDGNYLDPNEIVREMKAGDYENLVAVMEKYFGHLIIMYR